MKSLVFHGILLSFAGLILSCGPSKEELERRQQAILDSVARVTEERIARKINEEKLEQERQQKLEAEKKQREIDKAFWLDLLAKVETELEVQRQKLEDIKTPKLLRTISEKEDQVRNQLLIIRKIEREERLIKETLNKIENGEPYLSPSEVSLNKSL
jgi:hypothetical protein